MKNRFREEIWQNSPKKVQAVTPGKSGSGLKVANSEPGFSECLKFYAKRRKKLKNSNFKWY